MTHRAHPIIAAAGLAAFIALAVTPKLAVRAQSPAGALTEAHTGPLAEAVAQLLAPRDGTRGAARLDAADPAARDTDAALACLAAAVARGDAEGASALVERFFGPGAPAVDALLEALAAPTRGPGEADAFGVLLKCAVTYMERDPAKLAPWDIGALTAEGLARIGAGPHVPRALLTGLDGLGARVEPRHVFALVDAYTTRRVGEPLESQVPCHNLARCWAKSLQPAVEAALAEAVGDVAVADARRAQLAGLLIERDWRRFAPDLGQALAARRALDDALGGGAEGDRELEHVLAARILDVDTAERGDYFASFAGDRGVALAMAWQLAPEDARAALESERGGALQDEARALLVVRAGTPDALEAGRRLLAGDGAAEALERLVIGSWIASDHALTPAFVGELEGRFARRGTDGGRFWRALGHDLAAAEDHELEAGVLPWLERSAGERGAARERVLDAVKRRLPWASLE